MGNRLKCVTIIHKEKEQEGETTKFRKAFSKSTSKIPCVFFPKKCGKNVACFCIM